MAFIDGCRDKDNVLIIKNRHPDARKASERSHQRASRAEGPCVYFQNRTLLMQLSLALAQSRCRTTSKYKTCSKLAVVPITAAAASIPEQEAFHSARQA